MIKRVLSTTTFGAIAAIMTACQAQEPPIAAEPVLVTDIFMNQTGFETGSGQAFTVRTDTESALAWAVSSTDGAVIRQGQTTVFGQSPAAGHPVHQISVVPSLPQGEGYRLELSGVEGTNSISFDVKDAPFPDIAEDALRYFYLNRAGTPILAEHAPGPQWARAAGHAEEPVSCFQGTDDTGLEWPGCEGTRDVSGGWYDAGDYGKYSVNGGISVWMLLNAAERMIARGGIEDSGWGDGRISIPETGNGISEILDEARWEIEFLMKLQVPEGQRMALALGPQSTKDGALLTLTEIDASGLVHHKVHEDSWLPLPLLPENATEPRALIPPTTAGTLNLVAVTAQCARLWQGIDDAFAAKCLEAAERGYAAALRHPDIYAHHVFDGGGPYGDTDVSDEFAWAATELHATTGDAGYTEALSGNTAAPWLQRVNDGALRDVFWANVDQLPFATRLTAGGAFTEAERAQAAEILIVRADAYIEDAKRDGYGVPFPPDGYFWGSNGAVASRSLALGFAYDLTGEAAYRDASVAIMDYLLGRNPLGQSYIAGYGSKPVRYVHHRFWAAGADPAFPEAAPGALSGGPNSQYPAGPHNERPRLGDCAPQTCWEDDYTAYSLNEVAINWNAALFWLASYLDTTPPR